MRTPGDLRKRALLYRLLGKDDLARQESENEAASAPEFHLGLAEIDPLGLDETVGTEPVVAKFSRPSRAAVRAGCRCVAWRAVAEKLEDLPGCLEACRF